MIDNYKPIRQGKYHRILKLITVLTITLYMITPLKSETSMGLFFVCLSAFIVGSYCFFRIKRKENLFDFDVLFVVIYALCFYSTTFFIKDEGLYKALFLGYMFDTSYVNIGNILGTVGILCYYCGGVSNLSDSYHTHNHMYRRPYIKTRILSSALLVLTFFFVVLGGSSYSKSAYSDTAGSHSPLIPYLLLLITFISIVIITSEFYNKKINKNYKIGKLPIASIAVVTTILLLGGSRSDASYIILPVIGMYSLLVKPMKIKIFICFLLIGIIGMWVIGQTRSGNGFESISNPILLLMDLTVPSRNTYAVYEYVERYGFTCGASFVGVFTVIPLLSNFLGLTQGSGELLTKSFLSDNPDYPSIGLGTTVIADIYIAFGCIGVIILMYTLGRFVNKHTVRAANMNYYSMIVYAALISVSVFIVRGYITVPLRPVLWSLAIAYINLHLKYNKTKR